MSEAGNVANRTLVTLCYPYQRLDELGWITLWDKKGILSTPVCQDKAAKKYNVIDTPYNATRKSTPSG
ncbi:unnamed protein product [Absidia cylindrospora]